MAFITRDRTKVRLEKRELKIKAHDCDVFDCASLAPQEGVENQWGNERSFEKLRVTFVGEWHDRGNAMQVT